MAAMTFKEIYLGLALNMENSAGLRVLNSLADNFTATQDTKIELFKLENEFSRLENEMQVQIGMDTRLANESQRKSALNVKRLNNARWLELKDTLIPQAKIDLEQLDFNDAQLKRLFNLVLKTNGDVRANTSLLEDEPF